MQIVDNRRPRGMQCRGPRGRGVLGRSLREGTQDVGGSLPLAEAALAAQEAGRKYISVASALLQRAE